MDQAAGGALAAIHKYKAMDVVGGCVKLEAGKPGLTDQISGANCSLWHHVLHHLVQVVLFISFQIRASLCSGRRLRAQNVGGRRGKKLAGARGDSYFPATQKTSVTPAFQPKGVTAGGNDLKGHQGMLE